MKSLSCGEHPGLSLMRLRHLRVPPDLMKGKKVLDIGCGRKKLPGAVGLDRELMPEVDVTADLNKELPFGDEEFEAVYGDQVLEHIPNLVELVYEIYRVLKPRGIFLAHVPYFRAAWAHIDPTHVRSFTISTMDYFVKGTFCYENYRFREKGFSKIQVLLDSDYPSTFARRFFTSLALKNPWYYENSFWSNLYPFDQISYLLTK